MNDLHKLLESRDHALRMYNDAIKEQGWGIAARFIPHLKECEKHIELYLKGMIEQTEADFRAAIDAKRDE